MLLTEGVLSRRKGYSLLHGLVDVLQRGLVGCGEITEVFRLPCGNAGVMDCDPGVITPLWGEPAGAVGAVPILRLVRVPVIVIPIIRESCPEALGQGQQGRRVGHFQICFQEMFVNESSKLHGKTLKERLCGSKRVCLVLPSSGIVSILA